MEATTKLVDRADSWLSKEKKKNNTASQDKPSNKSSTQKKNTNTNKISKLEMSLPKDRNNTAI